MFRHARLGFAVALLWIGQLANAGIGTPTLLRYSATLLEGTSNGGTRPVRDFEIRSLVLPQEGMPPVILYLMDESSDEQPWFEQFGRFEFDSDGRAVPNPPRQRHRFESHSSWIGLWLGVYPSPEKLATGVEWSQGVQKFQVLSDKEFQETPAWQLEINAPQGRRTTLTIHKENGVILTAQHRFFVGMGERYDLNLKIEEQVPADASQVEAWQAATLPLLKLKQELNYDPSLEEDLSPAQRDKVETALVDIDRATDGTPFASLAGVIRRDVTASQQRETAVAELTKRFVGRLTPQVTVTPIDGGEPIDLTKPGKLTILHFWGYQEKPFTEPYGQVGYLDFLSQKRKSTVQVFGVLTDNQLLSSTTASAAIRSAKKLREFMNIGYPLVTESSGALTALGDPRSFGVELPLWVVIAPDGKILHYHVGFYEIDSQRGLEELDSLIMSHSKP